MKKSILTIALSLFFATGLFATEKNDIIKEIWDYYEKVLNSTKYTKSKAEIWAAMYSVASSECSNITKESESRGFIDAETKSTTIEKMISLELIPVDTFYRVNFKINYKYRYTSDGVWLDGANTKYKTKIKLKLYQAIYGELELSPELQKKVDDFNAAQTKSRKKILKGDDY